MNRSNTQFWIALIMTVSVATIAGIAVVGWLYGSAPERAEPVVFLLVGSLTTGMGSAVAWLFRLNGAMK